MAKLHFKKRIVPDAGEHLVTIMSVTETPNKFYNPSVDSELKKNQLAWEFAYVKKPEMRIKIWSSLSLSSYKGVGSKAMKIAEAALGKTLTDQEKEDFDTEELIGKKLLIRVEHVTKDGNINAKITAFAPSK